MMTKNNKGFIHILLILIIVVVLVVVGVIFLKGTKKLDKMDYKVGTTQSGEQKVQDAGSNKGLEGELNSLELSELSKDFTEVDSDIKTL